MLQKEGKYLKMEVLTLFLLIGCTLTIEASPHGIKKAVAKFLKNNKAGLIDVNGHNLELTDEILGDSENRQAVIWKGRFDREDVAIKISTDADSIKRETEAYQTLDAFKGMKKRKFDTSNDSKIENHGIPNVYYTGPIFGMYSAVVMTLFDETLEIRLRAQNGHFNAYSTLQVFLQSVKALKYINKKGIVHNDINPRNIFLRRNRVFIGDFHVATKKGQYSKLKPGSYASSRYWRNPMQANLIPFARDDLESLIYIIFEMEHMSALGTPDGQWTSGHTSDENVALMRKKCEHFANFPLSKEACLFIFIDQMFGFNNPDYDQIISKLEAAIGEVKQETNQTAFEWIKAPPRSSKPLEFGST